MSAEILLFTRLKTHNHCWMDNLNQWAWAKPDGTLQGPRLLKNVGLANLTWLALDMEHPPRVLYDWRNHDLCRTLVLNGAKMQLDGLPLLDQAASLTLAQFRSLCHLGRFAAPYPVPNIAPVLATLATGRLNCAHT